MARPFHLAVDLDNTVIDTLSACVACFNRVTGIVLDPAAVTTYEFFVHYGWDEPEYLRYYDRFGDDIHRAAEPYPHALATLRELARRHRLTVITARPARFAPVTLEWLARYEVPYHAISFTPDKVTTCRQMGADILLDDTPHHAEAFARAGTPMLLYRQPYNRHLDHPLVVHVHDWPHLRQRLRELGVSF
jgi:uncharacterized HAD superfamily protein